MPSSKEDLASELAYVKALAEEGRNTPLVNGVLYVIWGGLIGATALIVYADTIGWISLGAAGGFAPWIAAFVAGWVLTMTVGRRVDAKPGAATLGNKTAGDVWLSVGLFVSVFWIAMMFAHDNYTGLGVPAYFLFNLMFPVSFGLFGVAFFATAAAAQAPWMRYFATAAWGFSIICLFLMSSVFQPLVAGIGVLLCAFVPGVILMRREPSDVV